MDTRAAWLVALAACGSEVPIHFVDASYADHQPITAIDVVVSEGYAMVFAMHDTCGAQDLSVFPAEGACSGVGDAWIGGCPNCLGSVRIDDVELTRVAEDAPYYGYVTTTANSVLHAAGCGMSVDVPLHASGLPSAADVNFTRMGNTIVATWTSVTSSTMVTLDGGLGSVFCRVGAPTASYTFTFAPTQARGSVQPLLEPETTQSPFGPVRVWRGLITRQDVP